ncbi:MAG: hypothetical protein HGA46_08795 [Chlorobiaceae bacterium]|nr:hypothetical protein [Chlorobiaceae bacterium]
MTMQNDSSQEVLKSKLNQAIDEELNQIKLLLTNVQEAQQGLANQDRELHEKGSSAAATDVALIDDEIDAVRQQIDDGEKQLVAAEQKLSKVSSSKEHIGELLVGLSVEDLANLENLSASYQAFEPYLSTGLDVGALGKSETCAWSACWTCSEACGGCTGCGQTCSQINACISRQE